MYIKATIPEGQIKSIHVSGDNYSETVANFFIKIMQWSHEHGNSNKNITSFYETLTKIIFKLSSNNIHLICFFWLKIFSFNIKNYAMCARKQ